MNNFTPSLRCGILHLELWILNGMALGRFTTSMIHIGNVTWVCTMCVSCHCIYGTIVTACKHVLLINWFEVCVIVNWFKICVCLQLTKIFYACKKSLCLMLNVFVYHLNSKWKRLLLRFESKTFAYFVNTTALSACVCLQCVVS